MRGQQLFDNVFSKNEDVVKVKNPRGRSKVFLNLRNECLADRYFFYGQKKLRYDIILNELSKEFFISVVTVSELMEDIYPYLNTLKKKPDTEKNFAAKWPHLNWKMN